MTRWSEFEDIDLDYVESWGISRTSIIGGLQQGHPYIHDWDDAMRISLGIEGQPGDKIKLRGGYSFDQSAVPDEQATPLLTDTGDRHHLAGGLSYFYQKFEFAFAAEMVSMPERDVTEIADSDGDGIWDNLAGTYKNTAFNASFSVTLRF
jgi:long-subunit fatty acid transport protein